MSLEKKQTIRKAVPGKVYTWINLLGTLLFALYTFWLLSVHKTDLMFRIQELSLFLFDTHFFMEHLNSPGALLEYAGQFLSQFFYYPWLGTLILTTLFLLWQWMLIRAFDLPKKRRLLSLFPLAFALLYISMQEYSIFVAKYAVLSQVVGMILSVLPLFIVTYLRTKNATRIFLLVYITLFYPFLGFYALLGALLLWVKLFSCVEPGSYRKNLIYQLLLVVFLIGTPPLFFLISGQQINPRYLYAYGLPVYDYPQTPWMWAPLIASSLFLFGLSLGKLLKPLKPLKPGPAKPKSVLWLTILFLPLAVGIVELFAYKDQNFNTQLAMERAITANNWDKVLELARRPGDKPNRLIVIYRNIALYHKNQLCDRMFTFPNADERFHTKNKLVSNTIVGAPINCFYYGLFNYSYRWNMENLVLFGPRVENLRYMLMSALLNGEMDLSRKYISILQKTLFYKLWATEQLAYVENPATISENEQYKKLLSLTKYENVLGMDQRVMELTILKHFAYLQSGSDEMLEWSMSSILTTKTVQHFWPIFFVYVNKGLPLPLHVQEAALLLAYFEKKELGELHKLMNPEVLRRFDEFKRITESNTHLTEAQLASLLKKAFEKTYWYYFCFIKDLKTN